MYFVIILLFTLKSYAMDESKLNGIMEHCVQWGEKITSAKNIQQHIVACQRRNILVSFSKKYQNKDLLPNVVYGNFLTAFDDQMIKAWMYDEDKISKQKYQQSAQEFKKNITSILKVLESS